MGQQGGNQKNVQWGNAGTPYGEPQGAVRAAGEPRRFVARSNRPNQKLPSVVKRGNMGKCVVGVKIMVGCYRNKKGVGGGGRGNCQTQTRQTAMSFGWGRGHTKGMAHMPGTARVTGITLEKVEENCSIHHHHTMSPHNGNE